MRLRCDNSAFVLHLGKFRMVMNDVIDVTHSDVFADHRWNVAFGFET